ncbi:MAG: hypothetical protein PHQ65_08420 [Bacteroidales bacterium]|nr:hypothetical protein [Bacteroidales bacterium]MDD3665275.1 hypothetical protein [Bacteroidales bacterium]
MKILPEYKVKRIASIDLRKTDEGKEMCHVVVCEIKRNSFVVKSYFPDVESVEKALTYVPNGWPVCLTFGSGYIVNKSCGIVNESFDIEKWLVSDGVPGLDLADIAYQLITGFEGHGFVSIIRGEELHNIIRSIVERKIPVIGVRVGYFGIQHFVRNIEISGSPVCIHREKFEFEASLIKGYAEDMNTIDNVATATSFSIPVTFLPSVSTAYSFLFQEKDNMLQSGIPLIEQQASNFKNAKLIVVHGVWATSILLLILLLNSVSFVWLRGKNEFYEKTVSNNQKYVEKLETINKGIRNRERMIRRLGIGDSKRISVTADKIASVIPDDVSLEKLNINPVKRKGGSDNLTTEIGLTLIKGSSISEKSIELFLKNLRNLFPDKEIKVTTYLHSAEKDNISFSVIIDSASVHNIKRTSNDQ